MSVLQQVRTYQITPHLLLNGLRPIANRSHVLKIYASTLLLVFIIYTDTDTDNSLF